MYKDGKPQRNAAGDITKSASYQSREVPKARIEPNRKWFGNTRVISQEALSSFREAVAERASDPYQVLLKTNKLPMSLIRDGSDVNGLKQHQAKMTVETAPFGDTFGPRAQRKRVKLGVDSLEGLAGETAKEQETYLEKQDQGKHEDGTPVIAGDDVVAEDVHATARESVFTKGQSKRIWNELYKVIDSSDVVIHVLDARDPEGTRCRSVEKYIQTEAPHKHLVFVMNKCDLVPTGVAVRFFSLSSCIFVQVILSNFQPGIWSWSIAKSRLLPAATCRPCFYGSFVCYSYGKATLVRAELHSEARLMGLRFEGLSQGPRRVLIKS